MVSFLLIFYFKISSNWTLREGLSFHQRVREKQFVAMVCTHVLEHCQIGLKEKGFHFIKEGLYLRYVAMACTHN